MIHFVSSTGISSAVVYLTEGFSQHSLQHPQKQTERRIFCLFFRFSFILRIPGCLENLIIIYSILSLLLTDSPIHSKRFSESATDSKYVLKVLATCECECVFEKYGLQVFQNSLVVVLMFTLSKYSLLHSLFILTAKLRCFL